MASFREVSLLPRDPAQARVDEERLAHAQRLESLGLLAALAPITSRRFLNS